MIINVIESYKFNDMYNLANCITVNLDIASCSKKNDVNISVLEVIVSQDGENLSDNYVAYLTKDRKLKLINKKSTKVKMSIPLQIKLVVKVE